MRRIFFLFLILSVSFQTLAQTNVSGGIFQNTTWELSGSPYIINGSVVVFPGNTLTIEPGVEILINNQTSNSIYIETRGTINCIGTDQLPIEIRTLVDTSNVGWQGFICTSSQGGILNADRFEIANASAPFSYEAPLNNYQYTNCKFRHCFQAITLGNSVELSNCQFIGNETAVYGWSYFLISNCLFKDNNTAVFAYPTAFTMTNSQFIDNQTGVNFAAGVFDSLYISDCQFLNNTMALGYPSNGIIKNSMFNDNTTAIQYAYGVEVTSNDFMYNEIAIEASVAAIVHDNQIINNFGGIIISGVSSPQNSPQIFNNQICDNITYIVNNNTNMNYSLLTNCFCGIDSVEIENKIIDGFDDITKGLINYQVYDSTCLEVLQTVLKFNQVAGTNVGNFQLIPFNNPVGSELQFYGEALVMSIILEDISGRKFVLTSENSNYFNTEFLPSGLYYIIDINGQPISHKIIKI
jgi:hypothetical protein